MSEPQDRIEWSSDPQILIEQVQALAGEMDVDDMRALTMSLLGAGSSLGGASATEVRPSRRRPRQREVRTYRIRVDLVGATPPIWRRLDVASDLMLDDLHATIQAAFGWSDCHLHRFGLGGGAWEPDTEYFLCPVDVDEGEEDGVPEEDVRLDEVLVDVGDTLAYVYDYGDSWEHRIRVEGVSERAAGTPLAVCVNGRRACPPEDSGGIHWFQQVLADAADPASGQHAEAVEAMEFYGERDGAVFDAGHFDLDEVNAALESVLDPAVRALYHSGEFGELLRKVEGYGSYTVLLDVARAARLDEPAEVNVETATKMTHKFTGLLDRVGDEGIRLTAAGYLPPAQVEAAIAELGLHDEWIGQGNREAQTMPVRSLREAAQQVGLLRKYRGRLLLTKLAKRLRGDPVALWWHIAGRLPYQKRGSCEQLAGLVALAIVAAGYDVDASKPERVVADVLTDLGWRLSNGGPLTESSAYGAMRDTLSVLEALGAVERTSFWDRPSRTSPQGRAFARAALTAST